MTPMRFLATLFGILIAGCLSQGCATLARWDAELKARYECRRKLCNDRGLSLVAREIPNTGLFSYECCVPGTIHCEPAEECRIML